MPYQLVSSSDPILKQVCAEVGKDEDIEDLLTGMAAVLCSTETGVGLAAPQVGVAKRVVLIWPKRRHMYALINPVIEWASPEQHVMEEGCLSFPGKLVAVSRSKAIRVRYDAEQEPTRPVVGPVVTRQCGRVDRYHGFEARIIQHEVDHLNGICVVGGA